MRVALIIGHTEYKQGARNVRANQCEYEWNESIAYGVAEGLPLEFKPNVLLKDDLDEDSFIDMVNMFKPELVLELHFNSSDKSFHAGCEALVVNGDAVSLSLAADFCGRYCERFGSRNRGPKLIGDKDRGYRNISRFNAPAILLEPFFGSNRGDCISKKGYISFLIEWLVYLNDR